MVRKKKEIVITDDTCQFSFGPSNRAVAETSRGSIVIFRTLDCFSNQITDESMQVTGIDFSKVNPATGPIAVKDTHRGDTLKVSILRIRTADTGTIVTVPASGVLSEKIDKATTRLCEIEENVVRFAGIEIPAKPMIGVIGVASDTEITCGNPGRHGGNLDTTVIGEGASLYLPVFTEGALLAMGDLHAVMGDGEVCVAGCEVPGEVTVAVDTIPSRWPAWPIVETAEAFYILVSDSDLDAAFTEAVDCATKVLAFCNDLSWEDAYMLSSLVADLQVSQLVNPARTVRVRIPRKYVTADGVLKAITPEAQHD